jgi:hypothetical protein
MRISSRAEFTALVEDFFGGVASGAISGAGEHLTLADEDDDDH